MALLKSKKRAVFTIIALVVVSAIIINVIASIFFSFTIFKKDGWKTFEEYSYGAE